MKVALVGDVHANLPALEAVLDHAVQRGVEDVWNVGDFVGYGAFPNEVIERLRQEQAVSIAGNYDLRVLKFQKKRRKWRKKKRLEKFLAFQWTDHVLTKDNRAYLRLLPVERELETESRRILLTHGSPASDSEHLTPDTPQARLRALASMVEADLVICGHSHQPFLAEADGVTFINTGSVGRPDDGDPRASYAILEMGGPAGGNLDVRHFRVAYDVGRAVAAIREQGLPEAFAQIVIQGYALDEVMEAPEAWDMAVHGAVDWDGAEMEQRLGAVEQVAKGYGRESEHIDRVRFLALRLFDELQRLHRFGAEERFWLGCAALLHDIGWVEGGAGHHKTSLRLILEAPELPLDERERLVVGSIARYHRGALPEEGHGHFAALSPVDQYRVTILAALLRGVDGLDRTYEGVVRDLACELSPRRIIVCCAVEEGFVPEQDAKVDKGDLLERAFDRELVVAWGSG